MDNNFDPPVHFFSLFFLPNTDTNNRPYKYIWFPVFFLFAKVRLYFYLVLEGTTICSPVEFVSPETINFNSSKLLNTRPEEVRTFRSRCG